MTKKSRYPMQYGIEKKKRKKAQRPKPPSRQYRCKPCGAKTRAGGSCRAWAMANGRCRMHGGSSRKGIDHPRFATGLHSKYGQEAMQQFLTEERDAAEDIAHLDLNGVDDEIRLATALLMFYLGKTAKRYSENPDFALKGMRLIDNVVKQKMRRHRIRRELRKITLDEITSTVKRI